MKAHPSYPYLARVVKLLIIKFHHHAVLWLWKKELRNQLHTPLACISKLQGGWDFESQNSLGGIGLNRISILVYCHFMFVISWILSEFLSFLQQYWFDTAHCPDFVESFYGVWICPHACWCAYFKIFFLWYKITCMHSQLSKNRRKDS